VTHVLDRLSQHQGHLPLRNLFTQFIAGSLALMTGQTGGREGPASHGFKTKPIFQTQMELFGL